MGRINGNWANSSDEMMVASSIGELPSSMTRPVIDCDRDAVRAAAVGRSVFCGAAGRRAAGFPLGVGLDSCAFAPIARARKISVKRSLFIFRLDCYHSSLLITCINCDRDNRFSIIGHVDALSGKHRIFAQLRRAPLLGL